MHQSILEEYDLLTEDGALVIDIQGFNAIIANPETGSEEVKPLDQVIIHEVYPTDDAEPLDVTCVHLPAPLSDVLVHLSEA